MEAIRGFSNFHPREGRKEGGQGRWNYPKTRCPTYTENDLLHIGWQTGGGLASGIG